LNQELHNAIWQRIERGWSGTGARTEYINFLRLAFSSDQPSDQAANQVVSTWTLLPGLCCQAAGGDPHWAESLTAAWLLFYRAADLMDSVEDRDTPENWWEELGPPAALSAATGLYFIASRCLCAFDITLDSGKQTSELVDDFHTSFIRMCAGQHQDLITPEPNLDQYWQIAEGKSGTFFSLACRSGARLAGVSDEVLEYYSQCGSHIGVCVQILDDLEDLRDFPSFFYTKKISDIFHSLPVIYAIEVSQNNQRDDIKKRILNALTNHSEAEHVVKLIEESGAVPFIMTSLELHKQNALDYLYKANPLAPAAEFLYEMIEKLGQFDPVT